VSINATFFAQLTVFFLLVLFTMKFVWPPIAKALDERAQKISDGLADADKAKTELQTANKRVEDVLLKTRNESAVRLADAERRAQSMVREQVAALAVKGAEQILRREVNASVHADLLSRLKTEL
jgi:F-type H+-transporting ATPase subunit b